MSEDPWGLPPATLEPPPETEYRSPVQPERSLLRRIGGSIVAAALAVVKFGGLILTGLFKFKFALSFLITAGIYALFFGWEFGVGLVLLLLVHEMGHVIQLRREGLAASAPMFIPFMGAMVAMRDMPKDAWTEAKVGLAGPILGSVGALAVLLWAEEVDSNMLRALAYVGFLLNLFNLVPVVPLDGGRAVAALHPVFWFVGLFLVALLAFHYQSPFFFIVLVFVAFEVYRRWEGRNHPAARAYHDISWAHRVIVFTVYISLVLALVVGMHYAFVTVNN
ncbi:MAG TPA: site-2 protease family protein [Gaiellales bacterium]|jgi:Zn-dependent protease|nr:site-2 protease family protein [Gaiellales bacterium]